MKLKGYSGDAKTLLAFNLGKSEAKELAGFTIHCQPKGRDGYYLYNRLTYKHPERHAQVATEPARSSVNSPFHKFRWLHVPGVIHQGQRPFFGQYTYTVTPRYFNGSGIMLPIDPKLGRAINVEVAPFRRKGMKVAFTRGFTQSQAFVERFGPTVRIRPKNAELLFDTNTEAGTSPAGTPFTYADQYDWLGFTARDQVFEILEEVEKNPKLRVDVFAYDLNEPDLMRRLLSLAKKGRIRIILDNAALHHGAKPPPEDDFETEFNKVCKQPAALMRGKFGRYQHHKVFVVYRGDTPIKVLTGSTNFSVTGLYVNSNHVLVFEDPEIASKYAEVFEATWDDGVSATKFRKRPLATDTFKFNSEKTPPTSVTFAPHNAEVANAVLQEVVDRVEIERKQHGSVLFAVMELGKSTGPVLPALRQVHMDPKVFTYGISDTTEGVRLYEPRTTTGLLVTGKPAKSRLPPPFNQVPSLGLGHQIHHKFVVCGFEGNDPVVFCGSSNLALGGEQQNGDNLLAIHDREVVAAFMIEAIALVDHFEFLNRKSAAPNGAPLSRAGTDTRSAASAGWFLSTTDLWTKPYFDKTDLKCIDRELFAKA